MKIRITKYIFPKGEMKRWETAVDDPAFIGGLKQDLMRGVAADCTLGENCYSGWPSFLIDFPCLTASLSLHGNKVVCEGGDHRYEILLSDKNAQSLRSRLNGIFPQL